MREDQMPKALALGLCVVTCIAYWGVLEADFIHVDDPAYVTQNPGVNGGLSGTAILWAFAGTGMANWHPLTWISHMLDCQIWGLEPAGHHLTNLLLHLANTALLFWLLLRFTAKPWAAGGVALLFGLHPLHVESVAWISERKDVLCTLFFLATLGLWREWTLRPTRGRYLLALLTAALALMSKPMAVTLPFVLLLLDGWPFSRHGLGWKRLVLEKAPLFVLSGLMCLVTLLAQHAFSAVRSIETFPILLRITHAIVAYGAYLWLMIWPWNLSFYYPHPGEIQVVATLASLSILLLATGVAWFERRRRPWLGVGWLWYLGTLVPVIGLVQVGDQAMADRYTYIPLIGIFVALCYELAERARRVPRGPQVAGVALGLVGVACMALTVRQVSYWGTSERLTRHALEVVGERVSLRHLLGQALTDSHDYEGAIREYRRALELDPGYILAWANQTTALGELGRNAEAIAIGRTAVAMDPDYIPPRYLLARAYSRAGHLDEAIRELRQVVSLDPAHTRAQFGLALNLMRADRLEDAADAFALLLRSQPTHGEARGLLALTHQRLAETRL